MVLVTAEPGTPGTDEEYSGSPDEMMDQFLRRLEGYFTKTVGGGRGGKYHQHLEGILAYCWPSESVDARLRKTWLTNAVLCSAVVSGGKVPREVERACVMTYLKPQIELLENAYVLTLGGKARARLREFGVRVDGHAQHPSARPNTNPDESWRAAGLAFRRWLDREDA